MKYLNVWTYGILVGLAVTTIVALCPTAAMAQANGPCKDSTSSASRNYKGNYEALVSLTDPASVERRNRTGIPTLTPSQVRLVADTTICRAASVAYDAQLLTQRPSEPVIVLELGTKRLVVKDLGNGARGLNMMFNTGFTALLNMFWL
jgi:hypothetical protein